MHLDRRESFQKRIARFEGEIKVVNGKLDRIAWTRLLVFVLAGGAEIWSWYQNEWLWLPVFFLGMAGFIAVVKWNEKVNEEKEYLELKKAINEAEILRLDGKLDGFDEGNEFDGREHPYSSDLDLFGRHSLYQLINRASTLYGRETVANWLKNAAGSKVVNQRQQAAAELDGNIEWRQEFQATGMRSKHPGDRLESLKAWMEEAPQLTKRPVFRFLPIVLPIITLSAIVLSGMELLHWLIPLLLFMGHITINRTIKKYGEEVFGGIHRRAKFLKAFAVLIQQIGELEAESPFILEQKEKLERVGTPAHEEIASLGKILTRLELRLNGLPYYIMNHLFFWDIIHISQLERWKSRHGTQILDWFLVIGEMEAISSLAALRHAFPEWKNPEVVDAEVAMEGKALGHPLLPADARVHNPISLGGPGAIWLITGSNMSGKSTFLRTVGINAVLALSGAVVNAESLRIGKLQIATSMRTLDSLEENTSSFFAELKRLRMVIDLVESGKPVLFLLDEILKGTNSKDRHAGARALIKQLHSGGGAGLVSTHDLELADLEGSMQGDLKNFSFNCEVTPSGDLNFDYTLTPGLCKSMNATALMQTMGIQL